MSADDLHEVAQSSTPASVEVPNTYFGLVVWAIGKWGAGALFAAFLIPVYQDLKASNQRLADISQANVQVLTALATKVDNSVQQSQRVEDALRRLETVRNP